MTESRRHSSSPDAGPDTSDTNPSHSPSPIKGPSAQNPLSRGSAGPEAFSLAGTCAGTAAAAPPTACQKAASKQLAQKGGQGSKRVKKLLEACSALGRARAFGMAGVSARARAVVGRHAVETRSYHACPAPRATQTWSHLSACASQRGAPANFASQSFPADDQIGSAVWGPDLRPEHLLPSAAHGHPLPRGRQKVKPRTPNRYTTW